MFEIKFLYDRSSFPVIAFNFRTYKMDPIEEIKNVVNATTARAAATSEGAAIAYTSLLLMALFPVLLGSFRSVKFHKSKLSTKKSDSIDVRTY